MLQNAAQQKCQEYLIYSCNHWMVNVFAQQSQNFFSGTFSTKNATLAHAEEYSAVPYDPT